MSLLDVLGDADRAAVLGSARRHDHARGTTILRHGERGHAVHLLVSGRVAVQVTTRRGETVTLTLLGPGSVVGELGVLQPDARRSASVVACAPTRTLSWDRTAFTQLRSTRPAVEGYLVDAMSHVVRRLSEHLAEALLEPVETRVVRRLLAVAPLFGPVEDGLCVEVTQEELASMAGATRPTVNRVLRDLRQAGAVELRRGGIVLRDLDRLRALREDAGPVVRTP